MIDYTLEARAYDEGVAYRLIISGEEKVVRVPDECSTFVIPSGSEVWYHNLDGHYEAEYRTVQRADTLLIEMRDGGGFVGRFMK